MKCVEAEQRRTSGCAVQAMRVRGRPPGCRSQPVQVGSTLEFVAIRVIAHDHFLCRRSSSARKNQLAG